MILSEGFKWNFKKESAGLAEPYEYTGGTQFLVPPGPLGQILEYPEITLAEPYIWFRQFRQGAKSRQPRFTGVETISNFSENS